MKKLFCLILSLLIIAGGIGCAKNSSEEQITQNSSSSIDEEAVDSSVKDNDQTQNDESAFFGDEYSALNEDFYSDYSAEEKELYYSLWDSEVKIGLYVDIAPYELSKIDEAYDDYRNGNTYKADTYRKCNLTITVNGKEYYYEEVGIRMRGNTSRREFCNENGNIFDFVHFRFSLSETFDGEEYEAGSWGQEIYHEWSDKDARKARKNRSFATMEKFYYKWNKNYDNSYIREIYANKTFSAFGILAPHITLANLNLLQNGTMENMGVGGLYETIDKSFIERNFGSDTKGGDLYKCTYKADFTSATNYGVETPTQRFAYTLKTNNDRSDPEYKHNKDFKNFISVLSKSVNATDFESALEEVVDMDYFARFEAVNYLMGNPDCIRNNCNNFYLYFTPQGKSYLIPYDYDRCLGINQDWNPSSNGMIYEAPFSTTTPNGSVSNPLYLKTILNAQKFAYRSIYAQKLREVLQSEWFYYTNFEGYYLNYKENYQALAMPSNNICAYIRDRISVDRFFFSDGGASKNEYSSTNKNISTKDYMEIKRQTAEKAL